MRRGWRFPRSQADLRSHTYVQYLLPAAWRSLDAGREAPKLVEEVARRCAQVLRRDGQLDRQLRRADEPLPRPGRSRLEPEPDPQANALRLHLDELEAQVRLGEVEARRISRAVGGSREPTRESLDLERVETGIDGRPCASVQTPLDLDAQPVGVPEIGDLRELVAHEGQRQAVARPG